MFTWRAATISTRIFSALVLSILMQACAGQPLLRTATIPPLENLPPYPVADTDPLAVSEEMLQFLQQYAPSSANHSGRAFTLAYTMLDPHFFEFRYDPSITLTAEEVFRQRTGNCLSFSNLIIALARAMGIKAWFQEVEVGQNWSSVNETLLVSRHVNAVIQGSGHRYANSLYTVDVSGEDPGKVPGTRKISDDEARAQFYNNLGADALVKNELSKAYSYFSKALQTDPGISYIWSNLGVLLRRNSQNADAELAYLQALELNPGEIGALNNLYTLYLEEGDESAAGEFYTRVEKHRRLNPYYLDQLSIEAMDEQRYEDAIELARQAIRIDESEYRFYLTLARSQLLKGDDEAARLSLSRAKELAPRDHNLDAVGLEELAVGIDS